MRKVGQHGRGESERTNERASKDALPTGTRLALAIKHSCRTGGEGGGKGEGEGVCPWSSENLHVRGKMKVFTLEPTGHLTKDFILSGLFFFPHMT